ncbi:hypothetical protein HPP92_008628 [Vanilla planifolia]|uniref:Uncharacterized protein n=1 Tax=Vanilla planifolia TaxID=51239 RepID=A0A835R525_VANPL|nr:hypothetical protein HPP92_008628 [Vanilla planifolia]
MDTSDLHTQIKIKHPLKKKRNKGHSHKISAFSRPKDSDGRQRWKKESSACHSTKLVHDGEDETFLL